MNIQEDKIKEELSKTVVDTFENGWHNQRTPYGYLSYDIGDIHIPAQRNPKIRLDKMREHINFSGKKVLDFGCNTGGMLHHLDEIFRGVGCDYDARCIDAANDINTILGIKKLEFFRHDFDKDSYEDLRKMIDVTLEFKPEIILLLALGSWVSSWKELYEFSLSYKADIILEVNNEEEGKPQLEFFKDKGCSIKLVSDASTDDSTGNLKRRAYLIGNTYGI